MALPENHAFMAKAVVRPNTHKNLFAVKANSLKGKGCRTWKTWKELLFLWAKCELWTCEFANVGLVNQLKRRLRPFWSKENGAAYHYVKVTSGFYSVLTVAWWTQFYFIFLKQISEWALPLTSSPISHLREAMLVCATPQDHLIIYVYVLPKTYVWVSAEGIETG